jgi:biotin transport system permease protein
LLGIVEAGTSWLHRTPAGTKLAVLAVVGTLVGVLRLAAPELVAACVLLGLALVLGGAARSARLRAGLLRAQLRRTWWLLAALALAQVWTAGPVHAVTSVTGLLVCLWAATLVSATTPVPAMLDVVVSAARPLRRLGVDPDRVALGLTLTITSIPVVGRLLAESREAAAARGLAGDPRALLVPTLVRTVGHAEALGEALAARGLD